jgi:hypothetical protein
VERPPLRIDSGSVGDPARFRSLAELERAARSLRPAPSERGRVALIVSRGEGGLREPLARTRLAPDAGVPGDAWGRRPDRKPDAQIAVMEARIAELLANGQPLTLFGDNLFLDLDLSAANLPPGSRVRVGRAELEVTPEPHDGCRKFRTRFGADALRFVSQPELRPRNLRGIYMRVLAEGEVAPGDPVELLSRATRS